MIKNSSVAVRVASGVAENQATIMPTRIPLASVIRPTYTQRRSWLLPNSCLFVSGLKPNSSQDASTTTWEAYPTLLLGMAQCNSSLWRFATVGRSGLRAPAAG